MYRLNFISILEFNFTGKKKKKVLFVETDFSKSTFNLSMKRDKKKSFVDTCMVGSGTLVVSLLNMVRQRSISSA